MKKVENKRFLVLIIVTVIIIIIGIITSLSNNKSNNDKNNIKEEEETEELLLFKNIDLDQFIDTFKGDQLSIIYIGRPDCGYCQQFTPILEKVTEEYDLLVNYFNTNTITTIEDQQKYISIHGYLKGNGFSTPTILLVKDGAIYDMVPGYVEEEELKEFFVKNSFIKEE